MRSYKDVICTDKRNNLDRRCIEGVVSSPACPQGTKDFDNTSDWQMTQISPKKERKEEKESKGPVQICSVYKIKEL